MRNEEGTKPLFSERNGAGTKALFSERNGEGTIRSFFVPFYPIFTTFGHEKREKFCFKILKKLFKQLHFFLIHSMDKNFAKITL